MIEYGVPNWVIAYFPKNPLLDNFFEAIVGNIDENHKLNMSVEAYSEYSKFKDNVRERNLFVGVEFDENYKDLKTFPKTFRFSLLFPAVMRTEAYNPKENNWKTDKLFPRDLKSKPRGFNSSYGGFEASYILEGFVTMQYYIATQFIREVLKARQIHSHTNYQDMNLSLTRFPDPPYYADSYIDKTAQSALSLIPFAFLSVFVRTVFLIAEEKER